MRQTHQMSGRGARGSGALGEGQKTPGRWWKSDWKPNLAGALWEVWRKASWFCHWSEGAGGGGTVKRWARGKRRGAWEGAAEKHIWEGDRGMGWDGEERNRNRCGGRASWWVEMRPFSASLWKHRWMGRVLALEVHLIHSYTPDQWVMPWVLGEIGNGKGSFNLEEADWLIWFWTLFPAGLAAFQLDPTPPRPPLSSFPRHSEWAGHSWGHLPLPSRTASRVKCDSTWFSCLLLCAD